MFKKTGNGPHKLLDNYIVAYAALLPLGTALQNIGAALFVLFWLYEFISTRSFYTKHLSVVLVFVGYYLWSVVSAIYSPEVLSSMHNLYRMLPILVFPICIYLRKPPIMGLSQLKKCIYVFSFFLILTLAMNILLLFIENGYSISEVLRLPGRKFSEGIVNFHYLQLSYYISTAIILLLYILLYMAPLKLKKRLCIALGIIILLFVLIMLGSRTSLGVTLLLSGAIIFPKLGRGKLLVKNISMILISIMAIVTVAVYLDLPVIQKFKETINYKNQYSSLKKVWGGRMMREEIWSCSLNLIKERPVFGYGLGNVQSHIDSCLENTSERPELYLGSFKFNAHNQYFQFMLASGAIALILFVYFVIDSLGRAIKSRNYFFILFMTLSVLSFTTESMLQRNLGVNFFSFFSVLLFMPSLSNEVLSKKKKKPII